MITKISGVLNRVLDEEVRLQIDTFEYQVLVPEFIRRQLQGLVGEQVTALQKRIDEIGPVNLVAIDEYEETEQRHQFLNFPDAIRKPSTISRHPKVLSSSYSKTWMHEQNFDLFLMAFADL